MKLTRKYIYKTKPQDGTKLIVYAYDAKQANKIKNTFEKNDNRKFYKTRQTKAKYKCLPTLRISYNSVLAWYLGNELLSILKNELIIK